MSERELPMLAAIGGVLRWLEELVTIASGPVLTAGLAIALIDLLTDGKLLASQSWLLYAWAAAQALGVDGQLIGAAVKCGRAFRANRFWVALACIPLIGALGYVAYLASNVFATQQALGISTAQALAQLGMNSTSWIITRSALAVALVVLAGLLRYDPPAAQTGVSDERAKLERELELEPLRVALRARKAAGVREVASALRGHAAPAVPAAVPVDTTPQAAPAGAVPAGPVPPVPPVPPKPPAPETLPYDDDYDDEGDESPYVTRELPALQVVPNPRPRSRNERRKQMRMAALRADAFDWLDGDPTMTKTQLRDLLGIRQETSNDFYAQWYAARGHKMLHDQSNGHHQSQPLQFQAVRQ